MPDSAQGDMQQLDFFRICDMIPYIIMFFSRKSTAFAESFKQFEDLHDVKRNKKYAPASG